MVKAIDEKILEKKIETAKKDRSVWEGFSKIRGQMKIDDLEYESSFSCKLVKNPKLPKGDTYCKHTEFGKCAFYRCENRQSYRDWLQHHEDKHKEEKYLFVSCNECNNIRKKEVGFMNDVISNLELELKQIKRASERSKTLVDIAKNLGAVSTKK